jgi:hypothetical protein
MRFKTLDFESWDVPKKVFWSIAYELGYEWEDIAKLEDLWPSTDEDDRAALRCCLEDLLDCSFPTKSWQQLTERPLRASDLLAWCQQFVCK